VDILVLSVIARNGGQKVSIKSIEVKNFKSFKDLRVDLGNFNVIIGANASGKSNFVNIFKFLRDIVNLGLDNAISLQGDVEYLRNINIGASENTTIKIISDKEFEMVYRTKTGLIGIKTYETIYEFALRFHKRGSGFRIAKDRLIQKVEFFKFEKMKNDIKENGKLGDGKIIISRSNKKVKIDFIKPKKTELKKEDIYPPFLWEYKLSNHTLLLETPFFLMCPLESIFSKISIYDFDPKLPKKATQITGKAELEENANNLSIILKKIIENKDNKRKFFNLVKEHLPFVEKLNVEKFADKSLLFKLSESYFRNKYLPATLISDGTINITALIVALYFEEKPFVIIEEPERNIHPYLISKLVEMIKDASQHKQILVTTHNPEFVKYAGLGNILLVSRDNNGFSIISRPYDKIEVKNFLKNDIGIEELYIQNLLEV